jgi:hypothetical protein
MFIDIATVFVLDIAGYFGMFVALILAACVAVFLGCGLYAIAATVLGFWKRGK